MNRRATFLVPCLIAITIASAAAAANVAKNVQPVPVWKPTRPISAAQRAALATKRALTLRQAPLVSRPPAKQAPIATALPAAGVVASKQPPLPTHAMRGASGAEERVLATVR